MLCYIWLLLSFYLAKSRMSIIFRTAELPRCWDACMAGKHALHLPEAGLPVFMSQFGGKYSKEWESRGLKEGDVRLV